MQTYFYRILFLFLITSLLSCSDEDNIKGEFIPPGSGEFSPTEADYLLMDELQEQTIQYFWDGALPNSGLARERIHLDDLSNSDNIVTIGGSGFGMMAILVGVERGWISNSEAFSRFEKMVSFLETADRFHGVWPHWLDDTTGEVIPFGTDDDGGDLVETSFLIQGLLTVAEYYSEGSAEELALVDRIQSLYEGVEWTWYTQGGQKVLYWHWSPNSGWVKNLPIRGFNECLITYVLAASSPTYPIDLQTYIQGWCNNGALINDEQLGPLFFAHYSFLGLNPNNLSDTYTSDYLAWNQERVENNYDHCVKNVAGYDGYSSSCWGLTASYSVNGYAAHSPNNDLGVIAPTAALASMPYAPEESIAMLRYLYNERTDLIGEYGPFDAFSDTDQWYIERYLAIDQGPIPVMIENYRTGLLWSLFMQNEDVQNGLNTLGFSVH